MSTRSDRQLAARRAAAPSVDFSMLPHSPQMQALRELVAEAQSEPEPPVEPPPPPPAPRVRAASPVDRFAYRARPKGERTLQPFDPPDARALRAPQEHADAATAFVAAHLGAEAPVARSDHYTRRKQSEIPTLILDRRRVSPSIDPVQQAVNEQADDEPTFPPARGVSRRSQRLDTDLMMWLDEEEATLGGPIEIDDDVDPELDAWMRSQGRRRAAALVGALVAMIALCAAAMAGLVVMAGPLAQAPTPAPEPTVVAPPPAPAPVIRSLTVARGDTFNGLLANQPVDVVAVRDAALPLHDLARLEVGDTVVVELDPAGQTVREVRYALDAETLVVRKGADGWTASLE